jgi:hypothetical protein
MLTGRLSVVLLYYPSTKLIIQMIAWLNLPCSHYFIEQRSSFMLSLLWSRHAMIMSLIDAAMLQVPSMLPDEAFTVIRKSFDARKVLHGMISFLS